VKFAFYVVAAVMLIAALALLLVPLIRHGRRQGRPRGVFVLALVIAFVLPLATIGIYALVGTPQTIAGVPKVEPQLTIGDALTQLRARVAEHPEDTQAWLMLGQTYGILKQPADARAAFDRALKLDAKNTVAMIGWAEADSQSRSNHRIDGRARELVEQAVAAEPQSQRGLWLLGISDFQQEKFAEAAATWKRLQPLLDPDSNVAQAVAQQIAVAQQRASGAPPASSGAAVADSVQLQVNVSLSPALRSKLAPGDVLFVYARAEHGPPMPLAVAKLDADKLPASIVLTDGMGMLPQPTLSSAARVFVAARISKSGQAIAQTGDLEGDAGVVDTHTHTPIKILIDKVH
jgi:cytochrome c-type biogenesis protein CcmH